MYTYNFLTVARVITYTYIYCFFCLLPFITQVLKGQNNDSANMTQQNDSAQMTRQKCSKIKCFSFIFSFIYLLNIDVSETQVSGKIGEYSFFRLPEGRRAKVVHVQARATNYQTWVCISENLYQLSRQPTS